MKLDAFQPGASHCAGSDQKCQRKHQLKKFLIFFLFVSACCPPLWDKHGDSCYYVEKTATSKWQDARKKCQNMGADLAIITSSDENCFIANLTKKYNIIKANGVWLGLKRLADSKFYWIDGTPLEGHFQAWGQGQPDNSGGENCGHMRGLPDPGHWNDLPCSLGAGYAPYPDLICEKSISYF